MKRGIALLLSALMLLALCACGGTDNKVNEKLDTSKDVALTICGPWTASKAVETASKAFCEKYPNCSIVYEYVQNYEESLSKRMENTPESVDLFLTENIQKDSALISYAEDLFSHEELDLSDTNEALIKNFTFKNTDPSAKAQLYAIPFGGELRGLYVNKTLLSSLGLKVPTTATELLADCEALKKAGYVPVNGNPGMFAQRLIYPYVCNLIANADDYQKTYDRVNSCEAGVSELFREPMKFLYTLTENYYYNYKYVESELGMFIDNSDEGCAQYFFNVLEDGKELVKKDDLGAVAFMSGTLSQQATMDKVKEDYHSDIDYEFILAPVSEEGGFAYVSPSKGIAVNKSSANLDWAIEFMNFLFSKDVNSQYAEDSHYIPNTADSFDFIKKTFNIPENQISNLGKVTFGYDFYNIITDTMVSISKGNNPKYMDTGADGDPVMYSFDYYMQQLESAFAQQRENGAK